jgi:hypothetical protein
MSALYRSSLLLPAILIIIFAGHVYSQTSIHREESEKYRLLPFIQDSVQTIDAFNADDTCRPEKVIFGYHPYWIGSAWMNYRWNLLTDLCYFSYEVDPLTGNSLTLNGWETHAVIDSAITHQTRVHLCVTLFGSHTIFLNNPAARLQLITNVTGLLQQRNAHGVNLDFEAVPTSAGSLYNQFLVQFADSLHAAIPGCIVSIASPAVDWSEMLDIELLSQHLDYFMVMGYDYYWNGSEQAGPVSGLYPMTSSYPYSFSATLSWYLSKGAKPGQLLMGVPYYGRDWPVDGSTAPANTTASGTALTYRLIRNNSSTYSPGNLRFEYNSQSPYYSYHVNGWHHCFSDIPSSLAQKYELVNRTGIAGIGIWALGYDQGYNDLWELIRTKFTYCREFPCSDTLFDTGGPAFNYENNEQYCQTVQISENETLKLDFLEFNLDTSDTLSIYEGNTYSVKLIGSYTGNQLPLIPTINSGIFTMRFHSNPASASRGWKAVYGCPTAGTSTESCDPDIRVYPNPASSEIKIEFYAGMKGPAILTMADISGRKVYSEQFEVLPGRQVLVTELSKLSKGNCRLLFCRLILPDGKNLNFKFLHNDTE